MVGNKLRTNLPLIYNRLPGGVGVFLRGYMHNKGWQKNFGTKLPEIYAHSSIVLLEGYVVLSIGESLKKLWNIDDDFGDLMKRIYVLNPNILFGEVDARNEACKVPLS